MNRLLSHRLAGPLSPGVDDRVRRPQGISVPRSVLLPPSVVFSAWPVPPLQLERAVSWGGYPSFNLLPEIPANGDGFGLATVLGQVVRVSRLGLRGRRVSPGLAGRIPSDGSSAALYTQCGPTPISPHPIVSLTFFLRLGCVIGVLGRMSIEPCLWARLLAFVIVGPTGGIEAWQKWQTARGARPGSDL
jgi:hypothetical protein